MPILSILDKYKHLRRGVSNILDPSPKLWTPLAWVQGK
jgi:hypothetical protein